MTGLAVLREKRLGRRVVRGLGVRTGYAVGHGIAQQDSRDEHPNPKPPAFGHSLQFLRVSAWPPGSAVIFASPTERGNASGSPPMSPMRYGYAQSMLQRPRLACKG